MAAPTSTERFPEAPWGWVRAQQWCAGGLGGVVEEAPAPWSAPAAAAAARRRAHPARAVFTFLLLLPSPSAGLERVQRHALEGGQEELPARRRASNPWPRSSGRDPSARALTRRGSLSPSGRFASSPPPAEAEGSFNLPPRVLPPSVVAVPGAGASGFFPGVPGAQAGMLSPFRPRGVDETEPPAATRSGRARRAPSPQFPRVASRAGSRTWARRSPSSQGDRKGPGHAHTVTNRKITAVVSKSLFADKKITSPTL